MTTSQTPLDPGATTKQIMDRRNIACRELSDLEREVTEGALAGRLPTGSQVQEHARLWKIIDDADMSVADSGSW